MSNPLIMSYYIVGVSCCIALILNVLVNNWFSYLIILVFSGGIIILMIYVSSLASNLNSPFSAAKGKIILLIAFIVFYGHFFIENPTNSRKIFRGLQHLFFELDVFILFWVLMFLLFGIFLIVSLVNKNKGALR